MSAAAEALRRVRRPVRGPGRLRAPHAARRSRIRTAGSWPRAEGDHRGRRRRGAPARHSRLADHAAGDRRTGPAAVPRRDGLAAVDRADAGGRPGRDRVDRRSRATPACSRCESSPRPTTCWHSRWPPSRMSSLRPRTARTPPSPRGSVRCRNEAPVAAPAPSAQHGRRRITRGRSIVGPDPACGGQPPPGHPHPSQFVPGTPEGGTIVRLDTTLYLPETTPAPAVLLAHGFGGNKTDLDAQAPALARHGYVVLAYSARGFGMSGGLIHLDAPSYEVHDARKARRLSRHLAGRTYGRPGRSARRRRRVVLRRRAGAAARRHGPAHRGCRRRHHLERPAARAVPERGRRRPRGVQEAVGRLPVPGRARHAAARLGVRPVRAGRLRRLPAFRADRRRRTRRPARCCTHPARPPCWTRSRRRPCSPRASRTRCSRCPRPKRTRAASPRTARRCRWPGAPADTTATGNAVRSRPCVGNGSTPTCAAPPRRAARSGSAQQGAALSAATGRRITQSVRRRPATRASTVRPQLRDVRSTCTVPPQRISAPAGGNPAAISALPQPRQPARLGCRPARRPADTLSAIPGQTATFASEPLSDRLLVAGSSTISLSITAQSTRDATLFVGLRDVGPDGSDVLPRSLVPRCGSPA